jgi:hypothetical protein
MKPSEQCVWNAVDREWLLMVVDEAPLVFGNGAGSAPSRECAVDLDCGGCACGAVPAPCHHCTEHWTEDQP